MRSYISFNQHGFVPGRSITTNLTLFTSFCLRHIEEGYQIDTVYTDLKAAFDRVNHKLLLAKLGHLGLTSGLVLWLESYLTHRSVSVKLGPFESAKFSNYSGVPQGSNLGPLLFSIFFNDVLLHFPEKCLLGYADDLKLFLKIKNANDCYRLQTYVDMFANWCKLNYLSISISKCAIVSFSRKLRPISWNYEIFNTPLARANVYKDLGVLLDEKLSFRDHYSHVISKANKNLGFIKRVSKDFKDPYCLRSLYFALVRSSLETAMVVWCPSSALWINRIEAVQKRFLKFALRHLPWRNPNELPEYTDRCRLLGMETLTARRITARAVFVKKLLDGGIDCPDLLSCVNINVRPRIVRNSEFLRINFQRTNYGQQEPIRALSLVFNWFYELYDFNISTETFKLRIRNSDLLVNFMLNNNIFGS